MLFTIETEENNKCKGKLKITVYRKRIFSSVCAHFNSFVPSI